MGKQSSRIYFGGADHKDIYFQGKHHDKMYIGSELVWEKRVGFEEDGEDYILLSMLDWPIRLGQGMAVSSDAVYTAYYLDINAFALPSLKHSYPFSVVGSNIIDGASRNNAIAFIDSQGSFYYGAGGRYTSRKMIYPSNIYMSDIRGLMFYGVCLSGNGKEAFSVAFAIHNNIEMLLVSKMGEPARAITTYAAYNEPRIGEHNGFCYISSQALPEGTMDVDDIVNVMFLRRSTGEFVQCLKEPAPIIKNSNGRLDDMCIIDKICSVGDELWLVYKWANSFYGFITPSATRPSSIKRFLSNGTIIVEEMPWKGYIRSIAHGGGYIVCTVSAYDDDETDGSRIKYNLMYKRMRETKWRFKKLKVTVAFVEHYMDDIFVISASNYTFGGFIMISMNTLMAR